MTVLGLKLMKRFTNPLANVVVAAPCPAGWDDMIGGDRVRFCSRCELNVYNLSAMARLEAESLIARTEGRLCISYYRRPDGSIITDNCPIGLRAIKRRIERMKRALAATVIGFLAGFETTAFVNRIKGAAFDHFAAPSHGRTLGVMVPQRRDVAMTPENFVTRSNAGVRRADQR